MRTVLAILDVNGTLFSLDSLAERLEQVGLRRQLDLWFARILRDGFAAAAAGTFAAFPDLARHHLAALLGEHGQPVDDQRIDHVLGGFTRVSAHPDVEPGLRRLADAGVTVTTMTNGTAEITRDFLHREGLDGLVDAIHDVSAVGRWKPAPEAYLHVCDRHGVSPGSAALLAVHPWDVHGAIRAGLIGVWIDRSGATYPDAFDPPSLRAASFADGVDGLLRDGS